MLHILAADPVEHVLPHDLVRLGPLVITNQRVIVFGKSRHELDAEKITFVGRQSSRPLIYIGLFFLLTALPVVGYGAYLWISVRGMPTSWADSCCSARSLSREREIASGVLQEGTPWRSK